VTRGTLRVGFATCKTLRVAGPNRKSDNADLGRHHAAFNLKHMSQTNETFTPSTALARMGWLRGVRLIIIS